MIVSKRNVNKITDFTEAEVVDFAVILKAIDNQIRQPFELFPYSSGIHQSPTDGELHPNGIFTCILSTIIAFCNCKEICSYEMMGESQRDITEKSTEILKPIKRSL
jgi:UDPglucose--hexose-1-phosphate uridylyltransferase